MAIKLTEDSFGNFTADIPDPRSGKAIYLMVVRCEDAYWLYADGVRIPGEFATKEAAADAALAHVNLRRRSRTEGTTRLSAPPKIPELVERRPSREPIAYAAIALICCGVVAALAFTEWGRNAAADLVSDAAATTSADRDVSSLQSARPATIPLPVRPVRRQAALLEQHVGSVQQTAALTEPAKIDASIDQTIGDAEVSAREAKLPALPIRFDQFDASALAVGSRPNDGLVETRIEPEDVVLEVEASADDTLVAHAVQDVEQDHDAGIPANRVVATRSENARATQTIGSAPLQQSDAKLPRRKVASLSPVSIAPDEEENDLPIRAERRIARRTKQSARKRTRLASLGPSRITSTRDRKRRTSARRAKAKLSRAEERRALRWAKRIKRKSIRSKAAARRKVSTRKRVRKASRTRRSKGLVVRKSVYRLRNGRKLVRYRIRRPRTRAQYRQLQRLRNRIIAAQLRSRKRRLRRF